MSVPVCYHCGGRPKKGMSSVIMPELHSVCGPCGEKEYQKCLSLVGVTVEGVSAAQRRGEPMTFTLGKMSGKGIRMVARYLAVLEFGGKLNDSPEEFYERWSDEEPSRGRPSLEREFSAKVDDLEIGLREKEGFLSRPAIQEVASHVQKKLGQGMWLEGEVEADHHRDGVAKPKPSKVSSVKDVNIMVAQLKKATDPEIRRKLRRQLRKMGHKGGAR